MVDAREILKAYGEKCEVVSSVNVNLTTLELSKRQRDFKTGYYFKEYAIQFPS
jgi:hypothetical protein